MPDMTTQDTNSTCRSCGQSPCDKRYLACSMPEWPRVLDQIADEIRRSEAAACAPLVQGET